METFFIHAAINDLGVIIMTIKDGDFIKLTYTGKLEDGKVFDTTNEELARVHGIFNQNGRYGGDVIIIGANQTIPGLEEDIKQHESGYEGTVSIPPELGFGYNDPKNVRDLPMKKFEHTPQVGMQIEIDGKIGTVTKVLGRHARLDFNSLMAGQTVTYDYKIEEVIEGTKNKAIGLGTLYTGQELDIEIEGTVASVNVPIGFNYSQSWIVSKGQMALEIIKYTDITELRFIEVYSEDMLKLQSEEPIESNIEEPEEINPGEE